MGRLCSVRWRKLQCQLQSGSTASAETRKSSLALQPVGRGLLSQPHPLHKSLPEGQSPTSLDLELPARREVHPPGYLRPVHIVLCGAAETTEILTRWKQIQDPFSKRSCSEARMEVGFPCCESECVCAQRPSCWNPVISVAELPEPGSEAPAVFHLHSVSS